MTKSEMKSELSSAIKRAGGIEEFTRNQINAFAPEIMARFDTTPEKAGQLAKAMVMEQLKEVAFT